MRFLRVLKWLLAIVVMAVAAAVLYLGFADLAWLQPRIESAVAEATGREFKIDGRFALNLLPTTSVVLEDVSFANASWGSQPAMANIGHLSGEVAPWSLLSGPVRIRALRLRNVDLLLETDESEKANWSLAEDSTPDATPSGEYEGGGSARSGLPLLIEIAEIRDLAIRYKASATEEVAVSLESIDINTDEENYASIDVIGQVGGKPLKLAARLGPEQALVLGSGINIDMAPVFGEHALQATGVLAVEPEAWFFQKWTVNYSDLSLQLEGRLARTPGAASEVDLKLDGRGLRYLVPNLADSPIDIALIARLDGGQLAVDDIDARIGKSHLSGSLQLGLGDKIDISGTLRSKQLDLTALAPPEKEQSDTESATRNPTDSKYVFTEKPLPFETLHRFDLDLDTRIDHLIFHNISVSDIATRITLEAGDLLFTNTLAGPHGGRAASSITLLTSNQSASLDMDIRMRDLRLNVASGDVEDVNLIPPIDITLETRSSGDSPRALASSTSGHLLLTQGAGLIENKLIGMFGGDVLTNLFSALNPFSEQDEFTNTECAILALDILKGKADITALFAQGEKVKYLGGGEIDLGSEALNVEFRTSARKGVGVSPAMFATPFVKLKGTLARPSIALHKKGAILAASTGGLSVVFRAVVDRFSSGENQCAETLASVGDHPKLTD